MNKSHFFYQGRDVALLTQHGKQDLLRACLESSLGCQLLHTDGYDTDQLGTFNREVARPGTQLEAARQKAKIAMELTGAHVGIASEGAFGPDPFTGFMPWDTELLLWVDQVQGMEVIGMFQGPAQCMHCTVKTPEELLSFATEAQFPAHHLVLRPDHSDHPEIYKGLSDAKHLLEAFGWAQSKSSMGQVFVENDLRAFCNPTRQNLIKKAAEDLVQKLRSYCPKCHAPGYWRTRQIPGMLCGRCKSRTQLPTAEVWQCQVCTYKAQLELNTGQFADPSKCDNCNP